MLIEGLIFRTGARGEALAENDSNKAEFSGGDSCRF